jgi:hypothetical protein
MTQKERILIDLSERKTQLASANISDIKLANIADILQSDLGKGDSFIVSARKNISSMVEDYGKAIGVYNDVSSSADNYLKMANALGDDNMISRLSKAKKSAQEMIKVSNTAINKLKAI